MPYNPHPSKQKKKTNEQKEEKQLQIISVVNLKAFVSPQGIYNQVRNLWKMKQEIKIEKQVQNNRSHGPGQSRSNQQICYKEQ